MGGCSKNDKSDCILGAQVRHPEFFKANQSGFNISSKKYEFILHCKACSTISSEIAEQQKEYIQDLINKKIVLMTELDPDNSIIVLATSKEEARSLLENSPAIKNGFLEI